MRIYGHVGIGRTVHISTIPGSGMENGVRQAGIENGFWIGSPCFGSSSATTINCFLCSEFRIARQVNNEQ